MDLTNLTDNLMNKFSAKVEKDIRYQDVLTLMEKLKIKEKTIKDKFDCEEDDIKRDKQKLSLLVIKAQQSKAERLLNI